MVTLTTTENEQDLMDVFASKGITAEDVKIQDPSNIPDEEKKPTDDTPVEGAKHSETDPEGEKKPTEEEKSTQEGEGEKKPETEVKTDPETDPEAGKQKSKGGWQAKIEKKTRQIENLQERLDEEGGKNAKLQADLAQAQAELAKLKPQEDPKEEAPARPTRPKRGEFEFDDDKFEAAMDKYDADLEAYNEALRKKDRESAVKELTETQQKAEQAKRVQAIREEFAGKVAEGMKSIPDWDDLLAEIPDGHQGLLDKSLAAERYLLLKSKNPTALMHYLMNDTVNGEDAENERLLALDEMELVLELRAIEDKLTAKAAPEKKAPVAEADKKPAEKTVTPPAKEKPEVKKAPVEAPINPVGGRTQATTYDIQQKMEEAAAQGNTREFFALRTKQLVEKQKLLKRA